MSDMKQTVLVTGASGFLGQHIVKLLQEKDSRVKEIRCLDIKPYENKLGHSESIPMKKIVGDINDARVTRDALEGVDVVVHCAAVIDIQIKPDVKQLKRVNVDGTAQMLDACIDRGVSYFIHISTVDVCIGSDQIYFGSEATTPPNKNPVLGAYAETKKEAELLVQSANNRSHSSGCGHLNTIVLRPSLLYGEYDCHFIPEILKLAKYTKNTFYRIDNVFIRSQLTYVGNAAWAVIKAKDKLQVDKSVAGEVFFITDDTPIVDPFDFLKPIVEANGVTMPNYSIPCWLLIILLNILYLVVGIVGIVYEVQLPEIVNKNKLTYLANTYFFNRNKAIIRLDYDPLYSPEESEEKAMNYYKKLKNM